MSDRGGPSPRSLTTSSSTVGQRAEMVVRFDDLKYAESLEKRQKLARLCKDLETELHSLKETSKQSLQVTLDVTIFDEFKENCDMFSASKLELQLALADCHKEVHLDMDSDGDKKN